MRFIGIDPATTTGFVALDIEGNVLVEKSFRGKGKSIPGGISPEQRMSLENQLFQLLQPGDMIVKEGVAHRTPKLITTSKIHGGLEGMVTRKNLPFDEVAPDAVKKFVAVTGWKGQKGSKQRLKGTKEKKEAMAAAALKHFDYSNPSNDIVDAYIIARISLNLYLAREFKPMIDTFPYQIEVIESILNKA
ncbi:hypothetical protein P4H71_26165 [Paenibacillus kribbensis]|uniref:hypothetical protein n=1 Tax=Paenibacillus kribbensis TaxID=172713 RepID=UPI002DBDFB7D|nr:hypothetical protein [Paenibacillus kribbensis]MEC0237807.1 hypothetical protein [Paenibacillus kribbensis]